MPIRNHCWPTAFRALALVALSLFATMPARASFHLWQVKEVFSNADGSVQFIEMFDSFAGETVVFGQTLTANSDGNIKTFTFPGNLLLPTPGSLLIATSGFGSLTGGVTPDFTFSQSTTTIAGSFFNPNAANLSFTFTGSGDSMSFTGASLPKDGINSLTDSGAVGFPPGTPNISSGVNSPTNLAGSSGSVNLSTPALAGDYNGNGVVDAADYVQWRNGGPLQNEVATVGSVTPEDYTAWRARFGNTAAGTGGGNAVPEPSVWAIVLVAIGWLISSRRGCAR